MNQETKLERMGVLKNRTPLEKILAQLYHIVGWKGVLRAFHGEKHIRDFGCYQLTTA